MLKSVRHTIEATNGGRQRWPDEGAPDPHVPRSERVFFDPREDDTETDEDEDA